MSSDRPFKNLKKMTILGRLKSLCFEHSLNFRKLKILNSKSIPIPSQNRWRCTTMHHLPRFSSLKMRLKNNRWYSTSKGRFTLLYARTLSSYNLIGLFARKPLLYLTNLKAKIFAPPLSEGRKVTEGRKVKGRSKSDNKRPISYIAIGKRLSGRERKIQFWFLGKFAIRLNLKKK